MYIVSFEEICPLKQFNTFDQTQAFYKILFFSVDYIFSITKNRDKTSPAVYPYLPQHF